MKIIFSIEGGIGKCIAATAVIAATKKQYPLDDIIVISGYPDVFLGNKNVSKNLQSGNFSYFFTENVEKNDIKVMMHNPYLETDYVKENKHLIEIWCNMFGVKYNGEQPELFLTQREQDLYKNKFASIPTDKPILLMQTNGGGVQDMKYSFNRDLPSKLVVQLIDKLNPHYHILHVRRDDQFSYNGTIPVQASLREIIVLASLSTKRLLIDSFLQHACAALNLPSTVCWITNNPKVLGYELHSNIKANDFTVEPELRQSFLSKFDISGNPLAFPYRSEDEIFDADKILATLLPEEKAK